MKLSEAIRLGSMMKPQAFGDFYNTDTNGSCALGAACDALNRDPYIDQFEFVPDAVGFADCPACGKTRAERQPAKDDDACTIVHLNDVHRWSRERIADWVQTIEDAQEVKALEETATASV